MAERLVIVSDMYGSKKGLWITSYLGYLQQHFDIVFYDSKQLAGVELAVNSDENIQKAFEQDGVDTAVAHLLRREEEESHYLAFCVGGNIAWKAGLMGLPMKSLYAISPMKLDQYDLRPDSETRLLYGEYGDYAKTLPSLEWAKKLDLSMEIIPRFGYDMYSDEKIIQKVCLELLERMMKKQYKAPTKLPSAS